MPVKVPQAIYPLSPMQEAMLWECLSARQSGVNIEQIVGRLREEIDISMFRLAWEEVVRRHAVLRTAFRWEGITEPVQEVFSDVKLPFVEMNCCGVTERQRADEVQEYLRTDRLNGILLSEAPLMRVAIFRLGPEDIHFVWTFSHTILDGRSFAPVMNEVFSVYDSITKETPVPGGSPPLFQRYVEWIRKQDFSSEENYWRTMLKGFSFPTPLGNSQRISSNGELIAAHGMHSSDLSEQVTHDLIALSEKYQISLNILIQGAWAILLSRYSSEKDIVFGATRSCRRSNVPMAEAIIGILFNVLPVRVTMAPDARLMDCLRDLQKQQEWIRQHENTPFLKIRRWSEVPTGKPLFESIIIFERASLNAVLQAQGGPWNHRSFTAFHQTGFPLNLFVCAEEKISLGFEFDRHRFRDAEILRMLDHLKTILGNMAANIERPVSAIEMISPAEKHQLVVEWNQTHADYNHDVCIDELFAVQAQRTPNAIALTFRDSSLTYRETERRINLLASHLQRLGVGPDVLVGICVKRSLEMVIGILAILRAGGAYVPLDPAYPRDRLAHMISDSKMTVLLTEHGLKDVLPAHSARTVKLDTFDWAAYENSKPATKTKNSSNLAYVIYTSGSTGKPKGVMLTHRNVANFFVGADKILQPKSPGRWLAVTSICFDISVLELLWTLTRGFQVVIQPDAKKIADTSAPNALVAAGQMDFSLFYFSGNENQCEGDKYRLLLEGARFGDENGFAAIWTPERHFHDFGGLYPNPSLTGAAIATVTRRIQIRAGSVVLPLHDPIRVAEEWSVVDNLSGGRVGLSFASGWHSSDFVFAPDDYAQRKEIMYKKIEDVLALWGGETISRRGGDGKEVKVNLHPTPVRRKVPVWITASGSPETFRQAGQMGFNILTNLLGQSLEELSAKIEIYRRAWNEQGHGPGQGSVTLMLHTFLGPDITSVREQVRGPFTEYLKTSVDLIQKASSAWSFAAFHKNVGAQVEAKINFQQLDPEDMNAITNYAFERYFETSGLFGTPETCLKMVEQVKGIGVNEIACLIDFGIDADAVLSSLRYLAELNQKCNGVFTKVEVGSPQPERSIAAQMRHHHVTHFQCTPSLATMLMAENEGQESLAELEEFLVGGEALSHSLARQLSGCVKGRVHNMYGPTETTVWSTSHRVLKDENEVSIGRPMANTEIYILDAEGQPSPVGFAGEILIGGDGVARGYLNRSELTAEKFIRHPFSNNPSARLYRTGDLGRYCEDGAIEFLGRLDHQVKVRGHRIELGEIETVLGNHPSVREAVVAAKGEANEDQRLVAYIVPRANPTAEGTQERLSQWQAIWDGTYGQAQESEKGVFNTAGWTSSYTGEPIPETEMHEWVEHTVQRIKNLGPKRVLEIGFGSGLLLFRVAPSSERYMGVDFSQGAVDLVQRQLLKNKLSQVTVMQGTADDLSRIEAGSVDTVILNSVLQYFPNVDYLLRVLEGAVKCLASGGKILVGDVRSFALLKAFHASVEAKRSPDEITRSEFNQRLQARLENESELAIAPVFFAALKDYLPRIKHVEIKLKRGNFHNEMTRFRYDVVLLADVAPQPLPENFQWIDWSEAKPTPAGVAKILAESPSEVVGIRGVENARITTETTVLDWLQNKNHAETLGQLLKSHCPNQKNAADPESWFTCGDSQGWKTDVMWSGSGQTGSYDIVFRRANQALAVHESGPHKPLSAYANIPVRRDRNVELQKELRDHLKASLPEFMIPSAIVFLDTLPRTPNGKLDRKKLPSPNVRPVASADKTLAPRGSSEGIISDIWQKVLGLDCVGAHDNFFEIGGHSLLLVQVQSQLRDALKRKVSILDLLQFPTIHRLAKHLDDPATESKGQQEAQKRAQLQKQAFGRIGGTVQKIKPFEARVQPSSVT